MFGIHMSLLVRHTGARQVKFGKAVISACSAVKLFSLLRRDRAFEVK